MQVRYSVGSNGMIDVMALDMTSGKMARAEIHRAIGLSDDPAVRRFLQSRRPTDNTV